MSPQAKPLSNRLVSISSLKASRGLVIRLVEFRTWSVIKPLVCPWGILYAETIPDKSWADNRLTDPYTFQRAF